jgi:hypothetical protein
MSCCERLDPTLAAGVPGGREAWQGAHSSEEFFNEGFGNSAILTFSFNERCNFG